MNPSGEIANHHVVMGRFQELWPVESELPTFEIILLAASKKNNFRDLTFNVRKDCFMVVHNYTRVGSTSVKIFKIEVVFQLSTINKVEHLKTACYSKPSGMCIDRCLGNIKALIISPVTRRAATWPLVLELKLFLSNNVRMSTATARS